jgi:hypothetical protein
MGDHGYNDAKTETHAIELASGGIPLVAASNHPLYRNIPGRVMVDKDVVRNRVQALMEPEFWMKESDRARKWARQVSVKSENSHMESLLRVVNLLLSR